MRRARLELAKLLVDGTIDHARFDAARPRLAAFDARRPEPTEAELARPLESLTPPDWEERLAAIEDRGLVLREGNAPGAGRVAPAGTVDVIEPEWPMGGSLREELASLGVPVTRAGSGAASAGRAGDAGFAVEAISSRVPLGDAAVASLRERCEARPTAVVAFQADAFLDLLEGAALRVSACDATPLTRSVVARRLASRLGAATRA